MILQQSVSSGDLSPGQHISLHYCYTPVEALVLRASLSRRVHQEASPERDAGREQLR
jgi:hypothetical protein